MKKKQTKKPVYFIATKYKNSPTQVAFYRKDDGQVPEHRVEKKSTKASVRLFTFAR